MNKTIVDKALRLIDISKSLKKHSITKLVEDELYLYRKGELSDEDITHFESFLDKTIGAYELDYIQNESVEEDEDRLGMTREEFITTVSKLNEYDMSFIRTIMNCLVTLSKSNNKELIEKVSDKLKDFNNFIDSERKNIIKKDFDNKVREITEYCNECLKSCEIS